MEKKELKEKIPIVYAFGKVKDLEVKQFGYIAAKDICVFLRDERYFRQICLNAKVSEMPLPDRCFYIERLDEEQEDDKFFLDVVDERSVVHLSKYFSELKDESRWSKEYEVEVTLDVEFSFHDDDTGEIMQVEIFEGLPFASQHEDFINYCYSLDYESEKGYKYFNILKKSAKRALITYPIPNILLFKSACIESEDVALEYRKSSQKEGVESPQLDLLLSYLEFLIKMIDAIKLQSKEASLTVEEWKERLQNAVSRENYEEAAQIREKLKALGVDP